MSEISNGDDVRVYSHAIFADELIEIAKVYRREERLDSMKEVGNQKLREDDFLGVKVVIPV